jgi:hypothetical protein
MRLEVPEPLARALEEGTRLLAEVNAVAISKEELTNHLTSMALRCRPTQAMPIARSASVSGSGSEIDRSRPSSAGVCDGFPPAVTHQADRGARLARGTMRVGLRRHPPHGGLLLEIEAGTIEQITDEMTAQIQADLVPTA